MHDQAMKENSLFRWLPVLLWAILIFNTSANSNPYRSLPDSLTLPIGSASADQGLKKISIEELLSPFSHVGEYLVLAALTARALNWHRNLRFGSLAIGFGMCALYAISDEIHQLFVRGRAFQWSDLAFDLGGSALGMVAYGLIAFWRRQTDLI